jgi:hypothetical protein
VSTDPRAVVLDEARQCVLSDRNAAYGQPEDNFANIAALWNAYLAMRSGPLVAVDVAQLMILMKIARLSTNPAHKDSWVDVAGYSACGYRCEVV